MRHVTKIFKIIGRSDSNCLEYQYISKNLLVRGMEHPAYRNCSGATCSIFFASRKLNERMRQNTIPIHDYTQTLLYSSLSPP